MNLGGPASFGFADGLGSVFFRAPVASGWTFTKAVQADKFDLDPKDPLFLKGRKDFCQNPMPSPPAHPGVDRMPTTKVLGKSPLLTAVLGYVQDGVENLEVGKANLATLSREAVFDLVVLRFK